MFDQGGTLIKAQWEEIKAFVIQEVQDISARITHLEAEKNRYNTFLKRLQRCDHALGGTSLRGNPGASFKPNSVDPRRPNIPRENPVPQSGTRDPIQSGEDETNAGTVGGGDLVWLDKPQLKQKVKLAGSFDDAATCSLLAKIKNPFTRQIRRRRENLEYRLKKTLDKVFQVEQEIDLLKGRGNEVVATIVGLLDAGITPGTNRPGIELFAQTDGQTVGASDDQRFRNLFDMINDIENQFNGERSVLGSEPVQLRTAGVQLPETDGISATQKAVQRLSVHRNLFESHPATRKAPIWPVDDPTVKFDMGDGKTRAGGDPPDEG